MSKKPGELLTGGGKATSETVGRALAAQCGLPFVKLPEIPARAASLVPIDFQAEHQVVPFLIDGDARNERLHLAICDASALPVVDELRFQLRQQVKVHVATEEDIESAIAFQRGERMEVLEPLALEEEPSAGAPAKASPPEWDSDSQSVGASAPVVPAPGLPPVEVWRDVVVSGEALEEIAPAPLEGDWSVAFSLPASPAGPPPETCRGPSGPEQRKG